MAIKSNILKAIFLRKGKEGKFTKVGNTLPKFILEEVNVEPSDVLISCFKDESEWFLITELWLAFCDCLSGNSLKIDNSQITDVMPFSAKGITIQKLNRIGERIFVTDNLGNTYCLSVEEGPPFRATIQVLYYIRQQNMD